MAKPNITKTYGPIHFEDLEPHRFEDLVRQLIYDYKDWQKIEATGRSGGDDGFDIRAYEKISITSQSENEKDEEVEEIHLMDGNLWMIQCKREKVITPKKLTTILSDVDLKNPPYGYILAASTNFSKKSYDVFSNELRRRGVMEFYLWGKAELEDMLYLPKNDRILFTFFGISLVSKRKSKTSEIRSTVSIKNKLYKAVGDGRQFHSSVLLRDIKDSHYPYEGEYKDFKIKPRWKEFVAFGHHPRGLWCHNHEYFAYIDVEKKEWDFTKEVDLVFRNIDDSEAQIKQTEKIDLVKDVYNFYPKVNQGQFVIDCLVEYSDILLIDDKGDVLYGFPHLYVDFDKNNSPFAGCRNIVKIGGREIDIDDGYKRVEVFPKKFDKQKFGKIYKDQKISFNSESLSDFKNYHVDAVYEKTDKYNFLKPRDVILVLDESQGSEEIYIQITHKFKIKIKDYLEQIAGHYSYNVAWMMEKQLGEKLIDNEEIYVYEFRKVYKWELDRKKVI